MSSPSYQTNRLLAAVVTLVVASLATFNHTKWKGTDTPPAEEANAGLIYYDLSEQKFKVSQSESGFSDLVGGGGGFGDDENLTFGDGNDFSIRWDTGEDPIFVLGDSHTPNMNVQANAITFSPAGPFTIDMPAAANDADGANLTLYAQAGGTHTSNNPNGGSIILEPGDPGSGGAGEAGSVVIRQPGGSATLNINYDGTHFEFQPSSGKGLQLKDQSGVDRLQIGTGGALQTASFLPLFVNSNTVGGTSAEWRAFYLGEDDSSGIYLGLDQDARIYYDEATDDLVKVAGAAWDFATNITVQNLRLSGGFISDPSVDDYIWFTGSGFLQTNAKLRPDAANTIDLADSSSEFRGLYLGEDASSGVYLGQDQDARIFYDEATNDALTLTTTSNKDIILTPDGAGRVRFGTFTSAGGESYGGYITIKDAGGTSRKLAVFE